MLFAIDMTRLATIAPFDVGNGSAISRNGPVRPEAPVETSELSRYKLVSIRTGKQGATRTQWYDRHTRRFCKAPTISSDPSRKLASGSELCAAPIEWSEFSARRPFSMSATVTQAIVGDVSGQGFSQAVQALTNQRSLRSSWPLDETNFSFSVLSGPRIAPGMEQETQHSAYYVSTREPSKLSQKTERPSGEAPPSATIQGDVMRPTKFGFLSELIFSALPYAIAKQVNRKLYDVAFGAAVFSSRAYGERILKVPGIGKALSWEIPPARDDSLWARLAGAASNFIDTAGVCLRSVLGVRRRELVTPLVSGPRIFRLFS